MKTYIITGAGHFPGIGSSTALKLIKEKNNVVVNSRSFDDQWHEIKEQFPDQIILACGDIADVDTQQTLVNLAIDRWKDINGLINNASTGKAEFVNGQITRGCWHDNFQINVVSAYELSYLCYPYLKKTNGSIVNVSSRAALQAGVGNNMAYAVSKAALNHLTRNLALIFAPEITVNTICPGMTDSQRLQKILGDGYKEKGEEYQSRVLLQEFADPDQMADSIVYLLGARQITGQSLSIDGGASIQPKL
jgi:ketoreductase RED2